MAEDRALGASYELLEPLGRGGTGEVWLARDRRTGERYAAKVLHQEHHDDEALVERFVRERSILLGLRHPDVVGVRDLVVDRGRLAIVMELVPGGSLRDVLSDRATLRPTLALGVSAAVLDALAFAHERQVRHGDLKPDNVLLDRGWEDLGPGTVKLSDFGVAEILGDGGAGATTLVGTPEYLAPEQLERGPVGPAADVYAAGVLLYELLAGRTLVAADGDPDAVAQHRRRGEPPHLPVPPSLGDALAALLAQDPDARPTAHQAAAWLRELAPAVRGAGALPARQPPPRRGPRTEVRGIARPASQEQEPTAPSPAAARHRRR